MLRLLVRLVRLPPGSTLFPYTTLFRSSQRRALQTFRQRRNPRSADIHPTTHRNTVRNFANSNTPSQIQRSEEHTSELQSQSKLVCRLLLEKKKKTYISPKYASRFLLAW